MQKLTSKQRDIFDYIVQMIHQKGRPPVLREIGKKFGINSTNGVFCHLQALCSKGYLKHERGKGYEVPIEYRVDGQLIEENRYLSEENDRLERELAELKEELR